MTISDGPPAPPLTIHCPENDYLNIQIDGQDQFPMNILVHKNFSMKKFMYRYSRKIGLPISLLRFRFDGKAILFTDTPSTLGLVEGDVIDVFYPQDGGS